MEKYLLLIIVLLTGTFGQLILKSEANRLIPFLPEMNSLGSFLSAALIFLKSYKILLVLFLYGLGFLTWIFILTKFELSYVFPLMAVIYGLVLFFSWLIFKENISALRIIGTLIIILGIILVAKSR